MNTASGFKFSHYHILHIRTQATSCLHKCPRPRLFFYISPVDSKFLEHLQLTKYQTVLGDRSIAMTSTTTQSSIHPLLTHLSNLQNALETVILDHQNLLFQLSLN